MGSCRCRARPPFECRGPIDPPIRIGCGPRHTDSKCDRAIRRCRQRIGQRLDRAERALRDFKRSSCQRQPFIVKRVGIHGGFRTNSKCPRRTPQPIRVEQLSPVWRIELTQVHAASVRTALHEVQKVTAVTEKTRIGVTGMVRTEPRHRRRDRAVRRGYAQDGTGRIANEEQASFVIPRAAAAPGGARQSADQTTVQVQTLEEISA